MISHYNVISNVLQHVTYESTPRAKRGVTTQAVTGFLPLSHIYGLVIAAHTMTWRGDQVIILPKFEFQDFLQSVQEFKIRQLLVVRTNGTSYDDSLLMLYIRYLPSLSKSSVSRISAQNTILAASSLFTVVLHLWVKKLSET
jgi:acyl-CoA synthetase (AMP-forming)/AMP-acid ligase II